MVRQCIVCEWTIENTPPRRASPSFPAEWSVYSVQDALWFCREVTGYVGVLSTFRTANGLVMCPVVLHFVVMHCWYGPILWWWWAELNSNRPTVLARQLITSVEVSNKTSHYNNQLLVILRHTYKPNGFWPPYLPVWSKSDGRRSFQCKINSSRMKLIIT